MLRSGAGLALGVVAVLVAYAISPYPAGSMACAATESQKRPARENLRETSRPGRQWIAA